MIPISIILQKKEKDFNRFLTFQFKKIFLNNVKSYTHLNYFTYEKKKINEIIIIFQ